MAKKSSWDLKRSVFAGVTIACASTTLPAEAAIDEIIVQATRRDQSAQLVPTSLSVVTGDSIREQRIVDFNDIALRTPGLNFGGQYRAESFVSIRGTSGTNDAVGSSPGATIFLDEIAALGPSDTTADFYDIDRIEVLKGPQGTLFGRNVTGGAIAVYTRRPQFEPEASAELSYGDFNYVSAKGMINAPFNEKVATRFSMTATRQDGAFNNVTIGGEAGKYESYSARGQILFEPTPELSVKLLLDGHAMRGDSGARALLGNVQPSDFGIAMPVLSYDEDDTNQAFNGTTDRNNGLGIVRIDWDTGHGTLVAQAGVRVIDSFFETVVTADPLAMITDGIDEDSTVFSEEVRFASPGDQRVRYLVGLYNSHGKRKRLEDIFISAVPGSLIHTFFGVTGGADALQKVDINSTAVFGEVNIDILERLTLTGGGRYTWDSMSGFTWHEKASVVFGPVVEASYKEDWQAFTPKASLSWEPTDDIFLYFLYSKGYQSGGFDVSGTTAEGLATPFDPEFANNYEIGLKSDWLDNRLRVNATLFRIKYKDLQVREWTGTVFAQGNAGVAKNKGLELEILGQPADWLSIGANYTFNNSETSGDLVTPGGVIDSNIDGNVMGFTPKHQYTIFASANWTVSDNGIFSLYGDYSYRSPRTTGIADPNNFDVFGTDQAFYSKSKLENFANIRATYTMPQYGLEFAVWAKNLLNARATLSDSNISTFFLPFGVDGNVHLSRWTEPRLVGGTITYKFGG